MRSAVPLWPGRSAAVVIGALCLGPVAALAVRSGGQAGLAPADWAALRFTLGQAALSAIVSVLLAVPVARALARRRFRGRAALITLLGAPFVLPVLVAVLGLLAIFGRNGVLNDLLGALGIGRVDIYGLQGVVLAHVFLNLPLAVRLILLGWAGIPGERFRLAATLGAPVGRLIEAPMLRSVLPGAVLSIFLVCLTSFAVALTLGGGPRSTTVELAIYQALRFEADLGRAALLSLLQAGIAGLAALAVLRIGAPLPIGAGLDRTIPVFGADSILRRCGDGLAIGAAALFLVAPLAAVLWRGIEGLGQLPAAVWPAALRSVAVATGSVALCLCLALALALRGGWPAAAAAALPLAVSGLVLATGLFVMLFPLVDPAALALPILVLVNAVMALPFALRAIGPAVDRTEAAHGRLASSLGLVGMARLRLLVLPRIRPALGFAAGLAAALAMGDLGTAALLGSDRAETLPLLMARLMGAYRMEAAAGVALVLVALALGLFALCDRWGRHRAAV